MHTILDPEIYLSRMAKPLQEKLRVVKFLPEKASQVVDVGCADGAITIELAKLFPHINFLGIDLNEEFIKRAKANSEGIPNVSFEAVYLRELLPREKRYDAVIFLSVLHEFYSYGEGISSVVKAISDAHELIHKGGRVIVRDMILSNYTKTSNLYASQIAEKIYKNSQYSPQTKDFEYYFGKLNDIYTINHFLLKYWYTENWDRESKEYYVAVTFDEYEQIFKLLGMHLLYKESYLIPFLKEKWIEDWGLTEDEISPMRSTGVLVAQKM